jgi:hypothetical protein
MTKELKAKIKRRAKRVFAAIEDGTEYMGDVRQHKLRLVSSRKLYYNWRSRCGTGSSRMKLEVRRDSLGRIYIKEIGTLPVANAEQGLYEARTHGTVIEHEPQAVAQ